MVYSFLACINTQNHLLVEEDFCWFTGFFSQFGDVRRLKVSRSKKSGNSKHYAFLEFKSPQVAAIAAEAMNGYMLFTQKLDCHVLAASEVHKDLFKGTERTFKKIPWSLIEQKRHNKPRSVTQQVCLSLNCKNSSQNPE